MQKGKINVIKIKLPTTYASITTFNSPSPSSCYFLPQTKMTTLCSRLQPNLDFLLLMALALAHQHQLLSPFTYREVCFPSLHVEIIACIQCEFPHTKSTFRKVPNNRKKIQKLCYMVKVATIALA